MKTKNIEKGLAMPCMMYPSMQPNNINIINTLNDIEKQNLLNKIPIALYVDEDDYEIDRYMEVSFYLKNGDLLQNKVNQEYITQTIQGEFDKKGETIDHAIARLKIRNRIETLIIYFHSYKEVMERIVENVTSVSVINFN